VLGGGSGRTRLARAAAAAGDPGRPAGWCAPGAPGHGRTVVGRGPLRHPGFGLWLWTL
ncbi:MAG: hypothetical protein AVDCRST_MAG77-6043, partial [uncultured Chloroflexi bacterium]